MRIGLICDSHMPVCEKSAQWQFVLRAAKQFSDDKIPAVITLGDITYFGEPDALRMYMDAMSGFEHYIVLGNSDVRDKNTAETIFRSCPGFEFSAGDRRIIGINTPYARVEETDRIRLAALSDGDIVVMHHAIERLHEESREFMTRLCEEKALTVLYGHLHRKLSGKLGRSKLIGIRAIDPDKSFGDYPCVTYFDTESGEVSEKVFEVSKEAVLSARKVFGISCVDNHRDVEYAIANKLYGIELRCNGKGWEPDLALLPKIKKWRETGGKYLSVHMPNLCWADGELTGTDTWYKAVDYANKVGVDGLTVHPPRVKLCDMDEGHDRLFALYKYAVESVGENVRIGIENLHMHRGEEDTCERAFGCIPQEVTRWIDEINKAVGSTNRVGHTLDVGHAGNNGVLASRYPVSRWYEEMGSCTVAYHIHQVMMREEGLKNHNAIEDWFGPQISYVSFFYHWEKKNINNVPIFLEVKGSENFEKSIKAFEKSFLQQKTEECICNGNTHKPGSAKLEAE